MGMSMFPDDYAKKTAARWLNEGVKDGLFTDVPLAGCGMGNFTFCENDFAIAPDTNWLMIRGLYLHGVDAIGNKVLLTHLKKYNMEWGIPVAPEARSYPDWKLFGDQYSNFNAGKILNILEGIGGLRYDVVTNNFTHSESLPSEWSFMEFYIPVQTAADPGNTDWVHTRVSKEENEEGIVTKKILIEQDIFDEVNIHVWNQELEVLSSKAT